MTYDDHNIPIQCAVCPGEHWEDGLENMTAHIKEAHPNYHVQEIETYARLWMEDAYEREQQFWMRQAKHAHR